MNVPDFLQKEDILLHFSLHSNYSRLIQRLNQGSDQRDRHTTTDSTFTTTSHFIIT
jgi:hypothetical protein